MPPAPTCWSPAPPCSPAVRNATPPTSRPCAATADERASGEPTKGSPCHCRECQRRTGSTYGIAAFLRRAAAQPAGEASPSQSVYEEQRHT
ncbi:MAG: GFA family protein [Alphaproteobacteria bacterium]|nr:GFA family protein [Alphaproteobacteria bacterium]MCW5741645.1 GFA family protein [Alphaproteobacteria bacterium]